MRNCLICQNDFDPQSLEIEAPVCKDCFWLWVKVINHYQTACWISIEVFCQQGYCDQCQIFQIEKKIKERGLDKKILIGNY